LFDTSWLSPYIANFKVLLTEIANP
jgi:hypothetical protein